MPNNFNPFSTGLAEAIDRYSANIQRAVKICQPFNDFEEDVNQDLLSTACINAQAILDTIKEHQLIHYRYLSEKENENR